LNNIFIVGCGDIGQRVARLWRARGASVGALVRSGAAVVRLRAAGITTIAGDLDLPLSLRGLKLEGQVVYYFAPPPTDGAGDRRVTAFVDSLALAGRPARIVYLSTSGVYGDQEGALVDEEAVVAPKTERARRRLAAEDTLRAYGRAHGVPVIVLRVGGIYGPGRLPVERVRQGLPVLRPEDSRPSNRIHADDLAGVCVAAAERGQADRVYNVSDGQSGTMTEYFYAVADALGLPRPPAVSLAEAERVLTPAMISYLTESRRLDNRRMREELGVTLRYPDLASGLAQSLARSDRS
jgi:nucleoside-diphosphate-sugar epimerase